MRDGGGLAARWGEEGGFLAWLQDQNVGFSTHPRLLRLSL